MEEIDCRSSTFRHEAMLYAGLDEFVEAVCAFIREAPDEPALVVVGAAKLAALREALDGDRDRVLLLADMGSVGANPGRIIPAWLEFVERHGGPGAPLRGVGEPIYPERTADELVECHRHEALLNSALEGADLLLVCPYDTDALSEEVIARARLNHPFLRDHGATVASPDYPGAAALAEPFDEPLPPAPSSARTTSFDVAALARVRALAHAAAASAGCSDEQAADLVLAVNEVATNSIAHGGGEGTLSLWQSGETVVCEVSDRGRNVDPLAGRRRPRPEALRGRGLWIANQLCDLVQLRAFVSGGVVRLHMRPHAEGGRRPDD